MDRSVNRHSEQPDLVYPLTFIPRMVHDETIEKVRDCSYDPIPSRYRSGRPTGHIRQENKSPAKEIGAFDRRNRRSPDLERM